MFDYEDFYQQLVVAEAYAEDGALNSSARVLEDLAKKLRAAHELKMQELAKLNRRGCVVK